MNTESFVKKIRTSIIDENSAIYSDLFNNTTIEQASDPYWVAALTLFNKLNGDDRNILLKIIRQASVDTVSNVFAVLDGVSTLDDMQGSFSLTNGVDVLNGSLQETFLEIEEVES